MVCFKIVVNLNYMNFKPISKTYFAKKKDLFFRHSIFFLGPGAPTASFSQHFTFSLLITSEKHTAFPNLILLKFKEVRVLCFALNQFEVDGEYDVHLNKSQ